MSNSVIKFCMVRGIPRCCISLTWYFPYLINSALKTLTQNLCDEYYTELSVDMKTLEALLKKDGLATDEMTFENFKNEKKKDEQVKSNG